MFVERLLDQGNAPLLEQMLRFTAARHRLIAENVVNVDTPDYRQKDLSPEKFQALGRFIDRLQNVQSRAVLITSVSLSAGTAAGDTSATFTLSAYCRKSVKCTAAD